MTHALKAALVDVGGTLWPDRPPASTRSFYLQRLEAAFPSLGPSECKPLLAALDDEDPATNADHPLEQDTRAGVARALVRCGLRDDEATVDVLLSAMDLPARGAVDLFPGAADLLRAIKSLGLRCVVVSNATYRHSEAYRRDFRDFGVASCVDAIVSSVDLGHRKPGVQIFRAALEAAECDAAEAIVIGDSEAKDILPAHRLGMRAILVALETEPPPATQADAVALSLEEAATILTSRSPAESSRRPPGNFARGRPRAK